MKYVDKYVDEIFDVVGNIKGGNVGGSRRITEMLIRGGYVVMVLYTL